MSCVQVAFATQPSTLCSAIDTLTAAFSVPNNRNRIVDLGVELPEDTSEKRAIVLRSYAHLVFQAVRHGCSASDAQRKITRRGARRSSFGARSSAIAVLANSAARQYGKIPGTT